MTHTVWIAMTAATFCVASIATYCWVVWQFYKDGRRLAAQEEQSRLYWEQAE